MSQENYLTLFLAVLISFLMGLVIQRGGTCTVAAIHEILHKRTYNRIKALIETAFWVLTGEYLLHQFGIPLSPIHDYPITFLTIIGGVLLGMGAFINGACAVGTIARIGSGEWDFLVMLPGFLCGAAIIHWIDLPALEQLSNFSRVIPSINASIMYLILGLLLIRGVAHYRKGLHPYSLTILIGIFFLGLVAIHKTWSYTDLLVDIAMLKEQHIWLRIVFFIALLMGAIVSGKYQDKKAYPLKRLPSSIVKRFFGGAMMGAATLILPGSHDSLILLYMPMLFGYAWLGFTIMTLTILAGKLIQKRLEG